MLYKNILIIDKHSIDQYLKGDMTKSEYLAQNFQAVLNLKDKPFKNVDSVDKGLFNYQFYNAMAKQAKSESQIIMIEKLLTRIEIKAITTIT